MTSLRLAQLCKSDIECYLIVQDFFPDRDTDLMDEFLEQRFLQAVEDLLADPSCTPEEAERLSIRKKHYSRLTNPDYRRIFNYIVSSIIL